MNKPTLLAGVLTIAAICLFPPWSVMDHDAARDGSDDATEHVLPSSPVPPSSAKIMHRGAFMPGQWTGPDGDRTYTARIHLGRLLLQIVAAAFIFGGLAYGIGPSPYTEAQVREKVQEYDQSL